jgi:hypothetical protein
MQQHCRVVSKVSSRERRGLGAFQGRTKDLAQSDRGNLDGRFQDLRVQGERGTGLPKEGKEEAEVRALLWRV